jgi:peroxiredoxin
MTVQRSSRNFVLSAALVATALLGATSMAAAEAVVGKTPPAFTARDSQGRETSLAAHAGKTVVLEWTNPECPYVKKHYVTKNMQTLQKEARAAGVVWLTLTSADPGQNGYVNELEASAWVEKQQAAPTAFVHDTKGRIADAYGVKLALHMFVVDPKGTLAYSGAVDDKPTSKPEDVKGAKNYVREAIAAVAAGRPVQPASTRPYGCFAR